METSQKSNRKVKDMMISSMTMVGFDPVEEFEQIEHFRKVNPEWDEKQSTSAIFFKHKESFIIPSGAYRIDDLKEIR